MIFYLTQINSTTADLVLILESLLQTSDTHRGKRSEPWSSGLHYAYTRRTPALLFEGTSGREQNTYAPTRLHAPVRLRARNAHAPRHPHKTTSRREQNTYAPTRQHEFVDLRERNAYALTCLREATSLRK